jgi:hypothetical protein
MFKFVSEDMPDNEVAALYREGDDVIIMINARVKCPVQRCEAVTKLLNDSAEVLSL